MSFPPPPPPPPPPGRGGLRGPPPPRQQQQQQSQLLLASASSTSRSVFAAPPPGAAAPTNQQQERISNNLNHYPSPPPGPKSTQQQQAAAVAAATAASSSFRSGPTGPPTPLHQHNNYSRSSRGGGVIMGASNGGSNSRSLTPPGSASLLGHLPPPPPPNNTATTTMNSTSEIPHSYSNQATAPIRSNFSSPPPGGLRGTQYSGASSSSERQPPPPPRRPMPAFQQAQQSQQQQRPLPPPSPSQQTAYLPPPPPPSPGHRPMAAATPSYPTTTTNGGYYGGVSSSSSIGSSPAHPPLPTATQQSSATGVGGTSGNMYNATPPPPPPPPNNYTAYSNTTPGMTHPPQNPPPPNNNATMMMSNDSYRSSGRGVSTMGNGSISSRGDGMQHHHRVYLQPPPPAQSTTAYSTNQDTPKIDPSQIPRPPLPTRPQQQLEGTGPLPVFYPKQQMGSSPPPPADSRYTVQDDGNASPDFLRCSMYQFPQDRGVWHKTGDLPMGVLCTPLFGPSEDYRGRPRVLPDGTLQEYVDPQAVPLIGQSSPPQRCSHCAAYVNPFVVAQQREECNLCGTRNSFSSSSGAGGGYATQFGTVEYDVSGPYVTRETPVEPVYLIAIDLTCPHSYESILERIGSDFHEHWQRNLPFQMSNTAAPCAPPRIGICWVSSMGVVVRLLGANLAHVQYAIMPDLQAPFCHVPFSEWTFDLAQHFEDFENYVRDGLSQDIKHWKEQLSEYKTSSGGDGLDLSCGGVALKFLADALQLSGGRGVWISWRRPNYGAGRLPYREARKQGTGSREFTPLQLLSEFFNKEEETASTFYKDLASECAKNRVALDVLMHTAVGSPQPPLELASLGELCRAACGNLSWITVMDWQEPLYQELTRQVQSFTGWDAVFKVRCSQGIQVKSFLSTRGTLIETMTGSPELELACVPSSTCIAVQLEHRVGGIPKDRNMAFVQTALLYTNMAGKRRVRVSTLALRTTAIVNEVYRGIDFSALTSLLTRESVDCLRRVSSDGASSLSKARDLVYHRSILMLANYRQHTPAMNSPMGQLILPERMQLLPLFCMCLLKSPMLRPSLPRRIPGMQTAFISPSCDERAIYTWHVGQVLPSLATLMVHPNVFAIENTNDETVGRWHVPDEVEQANGFVRLPPTAMPSMESLQDDGVYLVDDGLRIFLYIGRLVADATKRALVDSEEPSDIKPLMDALIYQMRAYSFCTRGSENEYRPTWAPVIRIFQQEGHQSPVESDILNLMVADATAGEKDYVDFLCSLHRRIRQRIDSNS